MHISLYNWENDEIVTLIFHFIFFDGERLDYPHGYPNWWFLQYTEIKCPSEHFQNGKQYGCEVILSHFYSVPSSNKVSLLLCPRSLPAARR